MKSAQAAAVSFGPDDGGARGPLSSFNLLATSPNCLLKDVSPRAGATYGWALMLSTGPSPIALSMDPGNKDVISAMLLI